jgi:serine/threonine-protein kinase
MEHIEGKTLREWQREKASRSEGYRKSGVKDAVGLVSQIAEGLEKAHEKGIIHRDIKSENVMVTDDLRAKIMDFGLAKLGGVSKLTKTGSTIGTVAYMSPEQVEGLETDQRTDIFSFGVLAYELLSGQLPFRAAHETAMMYEIINVNPAPLTGTSPPIEDELNRIVLKCLEKDRNDRYQSMKEVVVDLKRYRRDSKGTAGEHPPIARETPSDRQRPDSSRWKIVASGAAVILLSAAAWMYLGKGGSGSLDSLAVLPFANANTEAEKEYITEGITENIINRLSGLSHLRVVPRSLVSKYKGKEIDPRVAGTELNVTAVLTGKVVQRGDDLVIQAELIDVRNVSQIWGEQYNRKLADLLSVQEDIVRNISEKLQPGATTEEKSKLTSKQSTNPEAYQLYLKGMYFWNKRTNEGAGKAYEFFKRAIEIDPAYALAYAGIADCYVVGNPWGYTPNELMPRMRAAAVKALELDENLAEAHASLAITKLYYEWDFQGGEQELRRAIALKPNYASAHHWLAEFLMFMGRADEGIAEYQKATELDPLSLAIASDFGRGYYCARQYDRAIAVLKKAIEMDPNFVRTHFYLSDVYLVTGKPNDAFREILRGSVAAGESDTVIEEMKSLYAKSGLRGLARKQLDVAGDDFGSLDLIDRVRDQLLVGDREGALRSLETGDSLRSNFMVTLHSEPLLDTLRGEPRFLALYRKMKFTN